MPDRNIGDVIRFENGGSILVGSDPLINVRSGTLKLKIPGYEPIPHKDRGVLIDVYAGDERACMAEFDLAYTSPYDASGIFAVMMGALTAGIMKNRIAGGKLFTFDMTVRFPDGPEATTGDQYLFNKCYLADGFAVETNSGADFDTLKIAVTSHKFSPTSTRY